ncbi:hypothetical protein chiPu_0029844, partial [Chiloscyllium punctatum]|nr:hypothetical protein [Chiloscyllium punctatum]
MAAEWACRHGCDLAHAVQVFVPVLLWELAELRPPQLNQGLYDFPHPSFDDPEIG